jgi:citrate lyase subunit beta/citryl-CoA lyase
MRSVLYVPADKPRALEKARDIDADALIFDLEDSVAPEAKAGAREALVAALKAGGFRAPTLVARLNSIGSGELEADITALASSGIDAVLLPKATAAEDIWHVRRLVLLAQRLDAPATWAMVETPLGVLRAEPIAEVLGPGGALVLGLNDLAKETGMAMLPGRAPMLPILVQVLLAARAHGALALDGVCNLLDDAAALTAECEQARQFGFDGKTLIHPAQVPLANAAFTPDAAELAEARAIVAAFAAPEARGKGVARLNGRMVELLHRDQALKVLARAGEV